MAIRTSNVDTPRQGRRLSGARARGSVRGLGVAATLGTLGVVGMVVAPLPAGAKTSKPTAVKATETDFHIALSKSSYSPGKYTFTAVNKGQTTHALEITGPGVKNAVTKEISPGGSAKLTVTFKKGTYDVFCPVPGHKMLGMNVNLTVGSASAATTSGSTAAKSSGGYGY